MKTKKITHLNQNKLNTFESALKRNLSYIVNIYY